MLSFGTGIPSLRSMAASLQEIVSWLDHELRVSEIPDYTNAVNGLQIASDHVMPRIIAAVDASLGVMEEAAEEGPGLLLVHHGMFWQGLQTVTGPVFRKLKCVMDAGLALYSSHIPLDVHPIWGNNPLLARELGLQHAEPFFEWKGISLGMRGEWQGSREALLEKVSEAVGGNLHLCPGGPEMPRKIGVITGGAGSEVARVSELGIDTLITGEGPHWSYPLAEELGINVIYAGHYATETFGVKALAAELSQRFGIPWSFIDRPTGL